MATKNHSEVVAGSRHAPHNLEYTSNANREAGTNEASGITLTAANVYQIAHQTIDDSFWILLNHSPITWTRIFEGPISTVASGEDQYLEVVEGGIIKDHTSPISLADDDYFDLPQRAGFGTFLAGPLTGTSAAECLHISWGTDGSITDLGSTTNTALTDSDTDFCAFASGNVVRIKNRLGSTKYVIFDINYYQPIVA